MPPCVKRPRYAVEKTRSLLSIGKHVLQNAIFPFLDCKALIVCSTTSSKMNDLLMVRKESSGNKRLVKSIWENKKLSLDHVILQEDLVNIASLRYVSRLSVQDFCGFSVIPLSCMCSLTELDIKIMNCNYQEALRDICRGLPKLTHLRFYGPGLDLEDLEFSQSIKSLDIADHQKDETCFNLKLECLYHLRLHTLVIHWISDQEVPKLARLTHLEKLSIRTKFLHKEYMIFIKRLKLRELAVRLIFGNSDTLEDFSSMPLRILKLTGVLPDFKIMVAHLKKLFDLRVLVIGACKVSDTDLEHMEDLPNLEYLSIRECQRLGADAFQHFHKLPLKELRLYETNVLEDHEITGLKNHATLQNLVMTNTGLTSGCMKTLGTIKNLNFVYFYDIEKTWDKRIHYHEPIELKEIMVRINRNNTMNIMHEEIDVEIEYH